MVGVFERVFHDELTAARNDGIAIGRNEERKIIMERLIVGRISPQQAAAFTGLGA